MDTEFNKILSELLLKLGDSSTENIDELINKTVEEMGVSTEGKQLFKETSMYIDANEAAYSRLQEAKIQGESRSAWMQSEIHEISESNRLTEEQSEQLLDSIKDVCENEFNNTLKTGE